MATQQIRKARLQTVRNLLRKHNANALVLTHNIDQFYVSGFFFYPEEAVFVIHPKGMACFTRGLYLEPFGKFAPEVEIFSHDTDQLDAALEFVRKKKLTRVGFDAAKESYYAGSFLHKSGFIEVPSIISKLHIFDKSMNRIN